MSRPFRSGQKELSNLIQEGQTRPPNYFCILCPALNLGKSEQNARNHYIEHLRKSRKGQLRRLSPSEIQWVNQFLEFQRLLTRPDSYKLRTHPYEDCIVCHRIVNAYRIQTPKTRFRIRDFTRHLRVHLRYRAFYCRICRNEDNLKDTVENRYVVELRTRYHCGMICRIKGQYDLEPYGREYLDYVCDPQSVQRHFYKYHLNGSSIGRVRQAPAGLELVRANYFIGERKLPGPQQIFETLVEHHQAKLDHIRSETKSAKSPGRPRKRRSRVTPKVWVDHIPNYKSKLRSFKGQKLSLFEGDQSGEKVDFELSGEKSSSESESGNSEATSLNSWLESQLDQVQADDILLTSAATVTPEKRRAAETDHLHPDRYWFDLDIDATELQSDMPDLGAQTVSEFFDSLPELDIEP